MPLTLRGLKRFKKGRRTLLLAKGRFAAFYTQIEDMHLVLLKLLEENSGEYAKTLNYHESYGMSVQAVPINVGEIVYSGILETSNSVVMTSATLGSLGKDRSTRAMEWLCGYNYVEGAKRYQAPFFLESPLNYKENAKVFLCDDVPHINEPNFIPKVFEELIPLIEYMEGRTLMLFSSASALNWR